MLRRVAVRGIIAIDGKLLCVRLKPYRHQDAPTYWCTPGGGIDPGEPFIPGLEREIMEETGVKPKVGNLIYIQQFDHKGVEQIELFFHVINSEDFVNIDLSKSSHGQAEIEEIDFIDASKENVLPEFLTKESFKDLKNQLPRVFNYL